jgi:hypothetical protein
MAAAIPATSEEIKRDIVVKINGEQSIINNQLIEV